jgi:hypothetical protein
MTTPRLTLPSLPSSFWRNTKWLPSPTHRNPLIWHPVTSSYFQKWNWSWKDAGLIIFNWVTLYGLCIIKVASQVTPCLRRHKLISTYSAYWFEGLSTWTQWQVALSAATTVLSSTCQINLISTSPQNESCSSIRCSHPSLIPICNKLDIRYEAITWTSTNYHTHICVKNQQMHPLFIKFIKYVW